MTEKQIKDKIKRELKKLKVWYFMPSASIYGRSGIPDFICCVNGSFVAIEAKSEKAGAKGLSPTQLLESRGIMASAGDYILVYNDETVSKMVTRLKELLA